MTEATTNDIPGDLLVAYLTGRVTAQGLADRLGLSPDTVLHRLHALGVNTTKGLYQRRRLARELEEANGLPSDTAWRAVADHYRRGHSLRVLAEKLGIEWQAARRLLHREGVTVRPRWHRSVFYGRPRDQERFAAALLRLRQARGWSQDQLGRRCGGSKTTIGYWERGAEGPSWAALGRLAGALGVSLEELGVTWAPPT